MPHVCGVFGHSPPCFAQVYLNISGHVKLGCLAQAMVVAPKDPAATPTDGIDGMDEVEGEIDMEIEVRKNDATACLYALMYQSVGHRHDRCLNFTILPARFSKRDCLCGIRAYDIAYILHVCACTREVILRFGRSCSSLIHTWSCRRFRFCPLSPPILQETPAGRKAAHREGKLRMKQEKLQRENACKKVTLLLTPLTMRRKITRWPTALFSEDTRRSSCHSDSAALLARHFLVFT